MLIKNLFILDDDTITTHLMNEIIKDLSFVKHFHIENNGWQALDYLQNISKQGNFPDILLIDLKMPEMDGFEFIEHYEELHFSAHPDSLLMVITSSVSERDRQKAMKFKSVSRFLHKPLTVSTLEEIASQGAGL
jgi:CheY-like chemotaxis protein